MEKSVKNAVFKGFPVLMESGPLGSKQYSQTTNEEKNNFLRSYFKVYYLVSKCTGKRVADRSAVDTALIFLSLMINNRARTSDFLEMSRKLLNSPIILHDTKKYFAEVTISEIVNQAASCSLKHVLTMKFVTTGAKL